MVLEHPVSEWWPRRVRQTLSKMAMEMGNDDYDDCDDDNDNLMGNRLRSR